MERENRMLTPVHTRPATPSRAILGTAGRATIGLVLALASFVAAPSSALAALSDVPDETIAVNGEVKALARSGNTLYIGGDFTQAGPPTGPWAAISPTTGQADRTFPRVSGGAAELDNIVSDGNGGWYIGGCFTRIGGVPRSGLAHVLADKTVDPDWDPDPRKLTKPGCVYAMARATNGTLYAGGRFDTIGANHAARNRLAALDPITGDATPWNPNPDQGVSLIKIGPTGMVYVAGGFASVGGQARSVLAALDPVTGDANAWSPNPTYAAAGGSKGIVFDLAFGTGGTVYVGGIFTSIGANATPRNGLAAIDTAGNPTPWNPNPQDSTGYTVGSARTLVIQGDAIYVGGDFDHIGSPSVPRQNLAAIDLAGSGMTTAWNPDPYTTPVDYPNYRVNDSVLALMAGPSGTIYVGGNFDTIGATPVARNNLAAIDVGSGRATDWNPNPAGPVGELALAGDGTVLAAGEFQLVGGQTRRGLAAIDLTDGSLTGWNPDPRVADPFYPTIGALAVAPSGTVYVAGNFTKIGANGVARRYLAALDPGTGNDTGWNPGRSGGPSSMLLSPDGATLYAAGTFSTIGSNDAPRKGLAALNTTTGEATDWDPNPTQPLLSTAPLAVHAIAFGPDGTMYVGGQFSAIGGRSRSDLAQVSLIGSGTATDWSPNVSGPSVDGYDGVRALAVAQTSDHTVYIGGGFTTAGADSAARANLAAISPATGNATPWNPGANWSVFALVTAPDGTVYSGGQYDSVGGGNNGGLSALNPATGSALSWSPQPNGSVGTILLGPNGRLFAGGGFTSLDQGAQQGFAVFGPPPAAPVNTVAPQVSGTAAVGQALACTSGSWSGSPSYFGYQWFRDGEAIVDAARTTYVIAGGDAGHSLWCRVTATNRGGPASADSARVDIPGGQSGSGDEGNTGGSAGTSTSGPDPGPGPKWDNGMPAPPIIQSGTGGDGPATGPSSEPSPRSPLVSLAAPRHISWRHFVAHGARLRVRCPEGCRVKARLLLSAASRPSRASRARRLLGRGTRSLPGGGRAVVRLIPVHAGRYRRGRPGDLRLDVRVWGASGSVSRFTRTVALHA